jgi:hypothetical protein
MDGRMEWVWGKGKIKWKVKKKKNWRERERERERGGVILGADGRGSILWKG